MKPFLEQIATLFFETYGAKISRFAFVFPNKRTGLFFQKYLSEVAGKPLFSPPILTINDLFVELSGKQPADRIGMLFKLYNIYIRKSGSIESFDEFLYWGEMLLNDFDDVDKYMADARMLFRNVTDLREIESDYTFLNEKQIAAIRTFWSSFNPGANAKNQENFLQAWELLYDLYSELREELALEGKGYEGMIFREVVEMIAHTPELSLPWEKVIFVGLNALSVAEEKLLVGLKKFGLADFYWDYDSEKVHDPDNKASFFVKRNLTLFPSSLQLPEQETFPEPEIEVIGIPSGIGQAKQVYSLVLDLYQKGHLSNEAAIRTAVILPDEHLLLPVLNAIPEEISKINVTMGYPLAGTPVASLMEFILSLQKNLRYVDGKAVFYFRDVLPVLNHRYILASSPEIVAGLISDITLYNKIYIQAADLNKTHLLGIIFTPVNDAAELSDYLINVLGKLNSTLRVVGQSNPVAAEDDDLQQSLLSIRDVEQEFIFHYFTMVNRMKELLKGSEISLQFGTYFKLLKRLTDTITIPFKGEPLSGLQVMGVLETRALDFDRIIILSMNEGIFPLKKAANSFIPYNLRRGFGLPTYEHQDSVWAYHFYRLIYRAGNVSLIYDTRNTGLLSGEKSRYIHQLFYHYEVPLNNKLLVYDVSSTKALEIRIEKSELILQKLEQFKEGGERALSASAINTYLDCPLKFYFSVIEDVREEDEVSESVESDVFGSILHKVLEVLYAPFEGKMVTADLLKLIRKDEKLLTATIEKAYAEIFFKTQHVRPLTGRNYLIGEMIRKYTSKVLARDGKFTPFRYIESERRIKDLFALTDGAHIQLKGFIDRIDEMGDTIRIIDYKSGEGVNDFKSVESLFDHTEKDRRKAVMQVFMYSWIYNRTANKEGRLIKPGIYYMRKLFSDTFDPYIIRKIDRNNKGTVEAFNDYSGDFEIEMRKCLDEIFNVSVPFSQSETGKACAYCAFKDICGVK